MSLHESFDDYERVVTKVSPDVRVIECRNRIQWIVQQRKRLTRGDEWRGVWFCRTKAALLRMCRNPVLEALPDRFPEGPQRGAVGGGGRQEGVTGVRVPEQA